jgi:hypothetical protein
MATRNAADRFSTSSLHMSASFTRPTHSAKVRGIPKIYIINRGKNTGAGAAYVYWSSPNSVDTTGLYYVSIVPWIQITDVIGVGSYYS